MVDATPTCLHSADEPRKRVHFDTDMRGRPRRMLLCLSPTPPSSVKAVANALANFHAATAALEPPVTDEASRIGILGANRKAPRSPAPATR